MAYTQTDLDALDRAIKSGTLTVRSGNDQRTYQSTEAMLKARAHVARTLERAANPRRRGPRYSQADFSDD